MNRDNKWGFYEYRIEPFKFYRTKLEAYSNEELQAELDLRAKQKKEAEAKKLERENLLKELTWKNVLLVRESARTKQFSMQSWATSAHSLGYLFFTFEGWTDVYRPLGGSGLYEIVLGVTVKDIK
jgi:hypothetical protein